MCWTLRSLVVLARISPARSAAQYHNHLMIRMFSRPYPNALASALAGPASIMRRLLVALGLLGGLLSPAVAADYDLPVLRGSEPVAPVMTVGPATFTRWSGFYVGGDLSFNNANSIFPLHPAARGISPARHSGGEQLHHPNYSCSAEVLTARSASAGFWLQYPVARSHPWRRSELYAHVVEHDGALHLGRTHHSADPLPLNIPVGTVTSVNLHANGHFDLTDYAEARGRAGYVVGNLLPYGFVGLVVGRAEYNVSATTDLMWIEVANNPNSSAECGGFPITNSSGQSNALLWGISVGGGLDSALTQNFFLRGEFEFIQFAPITNINVPVVSGRLGAGFKF